MTKAKSGGKNRYADRKINAIAPERNEIIEMLEKHGKPLQRRDIVEALKVESEDSREILRRRLRAMVRDGQLLQTRRNAYGLPARMDLLKGRISAHRDGFGFFIPDDGGSDLFISPREMRKVLHGDRVLAGVTGTDRQGRRESGRVRFHQRHERDHRDERRNAHVSDECGVGVLREKIPAHLRTIALDRLVGRQQSQANGFSSMSRRDSRPGQCGYSGGHARDHLPRSFCPLSAL